MEMCLRIIGYMPVAVHESGAYRDEQSDPHVPTVSEFYVSAPIWRDGNLFESISSLQESLQKERYTNHIEIFAVGVVDNTEFFEVLILGRSRTEWDNPTERWVCIPDTPDPDWTFLGYEVVNGWLNSSSPTGVLRFAGADPNEYLKLLPNGLHSTHESATYYKNFLYKIDYDPGGGDFMILGLFSVTHFTFDGPGLETPTHEMFSRFQ